MIQNALIQGTDLSIYSPATIHTDTEESMSNSMMGDSDYPTIFVSIIFTRLLNCGPKFDAQP